MSNETQNKTNGVTIVPTGCCHDCGGRCVLRAHVKDGKIIRFETDNSEEPQIRACLRGRAYRQRVYHPDRLKHPLRRVGERGEGKFEKISWDEALDEIAQQLKRIKETYGNSAIFLAGGSGNQGMLHGPIPVGVMLQAFGGFTRIWGVASYEGALFASMATYGTMRTGNSREDLLNSKFVIMWGWNPVNTIWDPETAYTLARVKEQGTRMVTVDPRYTDTAATLADQWIPIRPGTDTAMLIAMAYVIIKEGLQDQAFIDRYTVGYEAYKDYVLGHEDGVPKTPQWAEAITTVAAETIADLAREYGARRARPWASNTAGPPMCCVPLPATSASPEDMLPALCEHIPAGRHLPELTGPETRWNRMRHRGHTACTSCAAAPIRIQTASTAPRCLMPCCVERPADIRPISKWPMWWPAISSTNTPIPTWGLKRSKTLNSWWCTSSS
jgi:anaerobic selenocysteine-containing dehydrogenase